MRQKLQRFFALTDRHTDLQTKTNHLSTTTDFFLHICEREGGKHYEPYKISTSSLREGLKPRKDLI